jgi:hypothetical protein
MSALNNPDNFAGRVNYAASVITQGRNTSRSFDNCFENYDGDAVAAALVRRAANNERLAANLYRYINEQSAREAAQLYEGRKLPEVSRELIDRARTRYG